MEGTDEFITTIESAGSKIRAEHTLGHAIFKTESDCDFNDGALQNFLYEVRNAINQSKIWKEDQRNKWSEKEKGFATQLLQMLFSNRDALSSLISLTKQGRGLIRIIVQPLDNFSSRIPWELSIKADIKEVDSKSLLAKVAILRTPGLSNKTWMDTLQIRLLVVSTSSANSPDNEVASIEKAISQSKVSPQRLKLEYVPSIDAISLPEEIKRVNPHIVHLIAHGEEGALAFSDDEGDEQSITPSKLVRLLGYSDSLSLFVTTACLSTRSAQGDTLDNVSYTLSCNGIPAVIGMQFNIRPTSANLFSERFYYGIAKARSLTESFVEARDYLHDKGKGSPEWAAPVLYVTSTQDKALLSPSVKTFLESNQHRLRDLYQSMRDTPRNQSFDILANTLKAINEIDENLIEGHQSKRISLNSDQQQLLPKLQENIHETRKRLRKMIEILDIKHKEAFVKYGFSDIHEEMLVHFYEFRSDLDKMISSL